MNKTKKALIGMNESLGEGDVDNEAAIEDQFNTRFSLLFEMLMY